MVDRRAAGEIAAIALAADAVDEFAGQCRADLHFLNAACWMASTCVSSISVPRLTTILLGRGVAQVLARRAAENAGRQRRNHGARIDDGAHLDASLVPQSSAVMMQSCATSTRRRVRYPEFAVFSAYPRDPFGRRGWS